MIILSETFFLQNAWLHCIGGVFESVCHESMYYKDSFMDVLDKEIYAIHKQGQPGYLKKITAGSSSASIIFSYQKRR
jgi:hypothetical protein